MERVKRNNASLMYFLYSKLTGGINILRTSAIPADSFCEE